MVHDDIFSGLFSEAYFTAKFFLFCTLISPYQSILMITYVMSFCVTRATRELDGHQGDSAGGDGVQCEVPRYDSCGPAQRRGHGLGCHSQNCCHGKSYVLIEPFNQRDIDAGIL